MPIRIVIAVLMLTILHAGDPPPAIPFAPSAAFGVEVTSGGAPVPDAYVIFGDDNVAYTSGADGIDTVTKKRDFTAWAMLYWTNPRGHAIVKKEQRWFSKDIGVTSFKGGSIIIWQKGLVPQIVPLTPELVRAGVLRVALTKAEAGHAELALKGLDSRARENGIDGEEQVKLTFTVKPDRFPGERSSYRADVIIGENLAVTSDGKGGDRVTGRYYTFGGTNSDSGAYSGNFARDVTQATMVLVWKRRFSHKMFTFKPGEAITIPEVTLPLEEGHKYLDRNALTSRSNDDQPGFGTERPGR